MPDLTPAEVRVVEAAASGHEVDLVDKPELRPDVVRWLCTDASAKALIDPRGLRLTNARFSDGLDLRNSSIDFYLRFDRCDFAGDINLNDARIRSTGFSGCSCDRLLAWRVVISGGLFLDDEAGRPFRASQVILNDAIIRGNVVLERARLGPSAEQGVVLAVDRAEVRGMVVLFGASLSGTLGAFDADLGGIYAGGARFAASSESHRGSSVEIVRTTVKGDVSFVDAEAGNMRATGVVAIYGSTVGGIIDLSGAHIRPATAGNTDAGIGGQAVAEPTEEDDDEGKAMPDLIDLRLVQVGGNLVLNDTIVTGGSVLIWNVDIGQDLILQHFHDSNEEQASDSQVTRIGVVGTRIGKTLYWEVLIPDNAVVDLSNSVVDRLVIAGISYWPSQGQLWLNGLQYRIIEGPTLYRRQALAGPSRRLRKSEPNEPPRLPRRLFRKVADAVAGVDATQLQWLRLQTHRAYEAQPYDTLAAALRARGHDAAAVQVLIARYDDRRRARGPFALVLGFPYRLLVGNGFRTWWAGLWALLLTLIGAEVFGLAYEQGFLLPVKTADEALPFQPFVYSLDVLLPILDLGQASAYLPIAGSGGLQAFFWSQICFGWLLATAVGASAVGALQRRTFG